MRRRCKGDGWRAGVFFALSRAPALHAGEKAGASMRKTGSWLRQPLSFARALAGCLRAGPVAWWRARATPVRARHAKAGRARERAGGSRERGGAREQGGRRVCREKRVGENLKRNLRGKDCEIVYRGKECRIRAAVDTVGHSVSGDALAVIGSGLHAHRLQRKLFRF